MFLGWRKLIQAALVVTDCETIWAGVPEEPGHPHAEPDTRVHRREEAPQGVCCWPAARQLGPDLVPCQAKQLG